MALPIFEFDIDGTIQVLLAEMGESHSEVVSSSICLTTKGEDGGSGVDRGRSTRQVSLSSVPRQAHSHVEHDSDTPTHPGSLENATLCDDMEELHSYQDQLGTRSECLVVSVLHFASSFSALTINHQLLSSSSSSSSPLPPSPPSYAYRPMCGCTDQKLASIVEMLKHQRNDGRKVTLWNLVREQRIRVVDSGDANSPVSVMDVKIEEDDGVTC